MPIDNFGQINCGKPMIQDGQTSYDNRDGV